MRLSDAMDQLCQLRIDMADNDTLTYDEWSARLNRARETRRSIKPLEDAIVADWPNHETPRPGPFIRFYLAARHALDAFVFAFDSYRLALQLLWVAKTPDDVTLGNETADAANSLSFLCLRVGQIAPTLYEKRTDQGEALALMEELNRAFEMTRTLADRATVAFDTL